MSVGILIESQGFTQRREGGRYNVLIGDGLSVLTLSVEERRSDWEEE
jgi:hypothetical protein